MKTKIILLLLFVQPLILVAQITHSVSFKDIQLTNSKLNSEYLELTCEGLTDNKDEEGVPSLPSKLIHLNIPLGREIESITIVNPIMKTIPLAKKILPFQGQIPTKEIADKEFVLPLKTIYDSNTSYPNEQIRITHIDYFDYTNQIVTLEVTPFQYNAKNNLLIFYSLFDIQLKLKEKQIIKNLPSKFHKNRTVDNQRIYNTILSTLVDNPQDIQYGNIKNVSILKSSLIMPEELSYEYVIITNGVLAPAFKRFVTWKKRKGINIGIVTMEYIQSHYTGDLISGIYDDAGKLRQFLFDAYSHNLVYALLGGDHNIVPIRKGASSNNPSNIWEQIPPTDLYFSDFNGDWNVDGDSFYGEPTNDSPDYAAEIFVGRLLCSTPQHIENWTEKLIRYESNPGNGDFAYLKKAFYTQADEMQDHNWANTIKNTFTIFTVNTIFEETYNGIKNYNSSELPQFPTGADVVNEFNNNYGLVSFMGHGSQCTVAIASKGVNTSPKYRIFFSNSYHSENNTGYEGGGSFSNMTNYNYPNINYSISCETMPYDYIGSEQHSNHELLGKSFTVLYKTGNVAYLGNTRNGWIDSSRDLFQYFGQEINKGYFNIGISEANSLFRIGNKNLKYSHNLLGCPEMEMWTDIPSHFNTVTVSENGTSVTVNTGGISGCTIAVTSMDYGNSYFQVAKDTSSYTFTEVTVPYYITITKHNYIPYIYPQDVYIQNQTLDRDYYIQGKNIYVGRNVITSKPQGNVSITNNAHVIFDASENVILDNGFECSLGSTFEIRK